MRADPALIARRATTRTCTRSSSASWSRASATPAGGCTPAARATSRCRVDFRLYLRRRIPALQQRDRGARRARSRIRPTRAGEARDAVVHAPAPRAAGARRALLARARRRVPPRLDRLRRRARARPTCCRSARARSPARPTPSTSQFLAERLGFSRVVANSIDASGDRDFVATFLYACALAMVHLSRLAEDVILFSSEEFGFFELARPVATGSSLMPQKKNPDPLELVRGKAGKADRPADRLAGDDEGAADRLQQGSAGRQGDRVRGRGHGRSPARGRRRRSCARSTLRARTVARARRPACCSRPKSPTTSSAGACRSAPRTRSPGASSRDLYEARQGLRGAVARRLAPLSRACSTTASSRRSRPKRPWPRDGRRSPPIPAAVAAAAGGHARLAGAAADRAFVRRRPWPSQHPMTACSRRCEPSGPRSSGFSASLRRPPAPTGGCSITNYFGAHRRNRADRGDPQSAARGSRSG